MECRIYTIATYRLSLRGRCEGIPSRSGAGSSAKPRHSGFFCIPSVARRGVGTFSGNGPRAHFLFLGVMRKVSPSLQALVEQVVESLGYEPWGIELLARPSGGQLLRVYIEQAGGIGVDDCERVSRQLGAVLDVEDPIPGEYVLEVSSPGMDRPLYRPDQFVRSLEQLVRVRLSSTVPGRKNYRGRLVAVEGDNIRLLVDGAPVDLAMGDIESARVVPEFKR